MAAKPKKLSLEGMWLKEWRARIKHMRWFWEKEAARKEKRCSECRFTSDVDFGEHKLLECRYGPPIFRTAADGILLAVFPFVEGKCWCHRFESKG